MKILIAEDDPVSRLLLCRSLIKLGHEVVQATTGLEAWEACQKEPVPMVVSDWMMPDLEGPELCRRIRAMHLPRYTYFILLTTLSGREHYLEGIEAGADDFLTKPLDRELLQARLHVAERIIGLQQHVRHLEGLLPICAYCKKIRDDYGQWVQVESYMASQTGTSFTHGICQDCHARIREQIFPSAPTPARR